MAQFVTHIQPTLVETSHHHVPHHHHKEHHKEKGLHHHRESHQDLAKEAAAGGSYLDSHGLAHAFQLKFVDSQGIRRDYHGHGVDRSPLGEQQQGSTRPVPPKYIDVQPVYPENKAVSWFSLASYCGFKENYV